MMMHGTNTEWGGWADNLSMVMYISIPWLYNCYKMSNANQNTFIKAYIAIVIIYSILRWKFGYGMGIGLDLFGVSIGLWVISEFLYRFWSPSMRLLSGFIGFLVLMLFGTMPNEVFENFSSKGFYQFDDSVLAKFQQIYKASSIDDSQTLETIKYVYEKCKKEINFLSERLLKEEQSLPKVERNELSLTERINFVIENKFIRISYTEAFDILKNCKPNKKKKFKFPVNDWGIDFQSEHERFLVEKHFKCPVVVYDYPAKIKAFYMRLNDDKKTVRAMDILFPGIGEIVGGSQREERIDVLKERIKSMDIDEKELWWYLELRKYGSVKHSGFGLGLERLILFITGMGNIRDVIPFPRTPKNADF